MLRQISESLVFSTDSSEVSEGLLAQARSMWGRFPELDEIIEAQGPVSVLRLRVCIEQLIEQDEASLRESLDGDSAEATLIPA